MPSLTYALLPDRGVISVTGPDSQEFLQGLISNDITQVSASNAIYAALLTPQGKYLFDFFISEAGGELLVECEKARITELMKRLRMYKLRADANLADVSDEYAVFAIWGDGVAQAAGLNETAGSAIETEGGTLYIDPRLESAGARAVFSVKKAENYLASIGGTLGSSSDYDLHRLKLGLPDSSRDMVIDKSILLESGFDELNGVDWNKGCYVGQELTARTKYRGLVKKRLVPVSIEGDAPEPGAIILAGEKNAGEMRSSNGTQGLALLRLEQLENETAELVCDQATLRPIRPDWANF